jgi:hypothetical protein
MGNGRGGTVAASLGKAALFGALGGIVGSWAMSEFQAWWDRAINRGEPYSPAGRHDARGWQEKNEGTNANDIVGRRAAAALLNREPDREERAAAAAASHYLFGAAAGALYGAIAARVGGASPLGGAALGTAMWIGADNVAMPLLGLARSDIDYPVESHVQSFASHIVYGLATQSTYGLLRKAYDSR